MTSPRLTMTVPAGSSLSFTAADGSRLDVPVIGQLNRLVALDDHR